MTHYRVLRTLEAFYHLRPLGRAAAARPITDVWKVAQPGSAFHCGHFGQRDLDGAGGPPAAGLTSQRGTYRPWFADADAPWFAGLTDPSGEGPFSADPGGRSG